MKSKYLTNTTLSKVFQNSFGNDSVNGLFSIFGSWVTQNTQYDDSAIFFKINAFNIIRKCILLVLLRKGFLIDAE